MTMKKEIQVKIIDCSTGTIANVNYSSNEYTHARYNPTTNSCELMTKKNFDDLLNSSVTGFVAANCFASVHFDSLKHAYYKTGGKIWFEKNQWNDQTSKFAGERKDFYENISHLYLINVKNVSNSGWCGENCDKYPVQCSLDWRKPILVAAYDEFTNAISKGAEAIFELHESQRIKMKIEKSFDFFTRKITGRNKNINFY